METKIQMLLASTEGQKHKVFSQPHLAQEEANRTNGLRKKNRGQLFNPKDIQEEAVGFFQNFYGEIPGPIRELPPSRFLNLDQGGKDLLGKEVSNEEIKMTLFDMAPLKAPGSDGYYAFFFHNQWEEIRGPVCEWVKRVFKGNPIKLELNNTLIVLISKVAHP